MLVTSGEIRTNSLVMFSYQLLDMDTPVLANQLFTDTGCFQEDLLWMIGTEDEKESLNSVLSLCFEDDDDDDDDDDDFYWSNIFWSMHSFSFNYIGFYNCLECTF